MRGLLRGRGRSPFLQFAVSGLVATALIGLIAALVLRQVGRQEAIRDAKQTTRLAGEGIVAPLVDAAVLRGDRPALKRLDRVVRRRVLPEGIVRVKLWTADGTIVYSDEPLLVGARFPLGEDEVASMRAGRVEAELSDLSRPENSFERAEGKLLEVYLPIQGAGDRRVLFEAYQRYSSVAASGRRLWTAFAPALVGGLVLLQLVNLPLARSLARRLEHGRREREALLRRALDASDTERRAIAADLHDGVVQDLAGVSFALTAQADRLGQRDAEAGSELRRGAATTRDSIRALRTLLVDIYPPNLQRAGLPAALGDLATTASARGVATEARVPDGLGLAPATEQLLFRCAQEAIRNVHKHARAATARIDVRAEGPEVVLEVGDDGAGFTPDVLETRRREGHVGLQAMGDLVRDAGGHLDVDAAPGRGTTVRVRVPR